MNHMYHFRRPPSPEQPRRTAGEWNGLYLRQYKGEDDLKQIIELIDKELSEPYSIFTYRYFLSTWPKLSWLAFAGDDHCVGAVVSKQEPHNGLSRGYIAMLVVQKQHRKKGLGKELVKRTIWEMKANDADEVVLEAEVSNEGALALYQGLGFIRDKRLAKYYLSGSDAFRLKLMLPLSPERARVVEREAALQQAAEEQAQRKALEKQLQQAQQSFQDEALRQASLGELHELQKEAQIEQLKVKVAAAQQAGWLGSSSDSDDLPEGFLGAPSGAEQERAFKQRLRQAAAKEAAIAREIARRAPAVAGQQPAAARGRAADATKREVEKLLSNVVGLNIGSSGSGGGEDKGLKGGFLI